jgi:hypothetical protein
MGYRSKLGLNNGQKVVKECFSLHKNNFNFFWDENPFQAILSLNET